MTATGLSKDDGFGDAGISSHAFNI